MFLIIQTTNSSFISSDGGNEYANLELAKEAAIAGSLQIAGDEIRGGKSGSTVDVILKDRAGREHHRMAIGISVAPLFLTGIGLTTAN